MTPHTSLIPTLCCQVSSWRRHSCVLIYSSTSMGEKSLTQHTTAAQAGIESMVILWDFHPITNQQLYPWLLLMAIVYHDRLLGAVLELLTWAGVGITPTPPYCESFINRYLVTDCKAKHKLQFQHSSNSYRFMHGWVQRKVHRTWDVGIRMVGGSWETSCVMYGL